MTLLKENTKTLTGAKILVETLKKLNVDTIFGYPGGIVLEVYDELYKQNDIKHYLVRHEQAAIHAAEGYARVSSKCGVAIVTSGPGATNIVTGVANAYLDGYPLVVITGQVMSSLIGKDAFQEVDIIDITRTCTKKNFQVRSIDNLENTLVEAFNTALSGRKGPVVVDIAKNVFNEKAEIQNLQMTSIPPLNNSGIDIIKKALCEICNAKRPVIISGGGVTLSGASNEVMTFAKMLDIPVVNTMMGIGTYPADDKNYLGMIGLFGNYSANQAVKESDLIFAVGTRFNDRIRCCFKNNELGKHLVHLDIDKNEISRLVKASTALEGDAKQVLNMMISEYKSGNYHYNTRIREEWLKDVNEFKSKNCDVVRKSSKLHSYDVIKAISDYVSKKDLTVTTEVGQHQVWAARALKFNSPQRFLTSGGLGTMGFGFPAAIGASVANNNSEVVCIAGDGSIQMNIQELAVCVQYNLPVKVFILNNGYLGMVRQFQEKSCEKRYSQTKISNPDYITLAKAYGANGIKVQNESELNYAIKQAFSINGPVLVDIEIEPEEVL
ncbi:biosynthetic-type acetolactate synthase large subunit [bacterium]|nr:biosynthetic-type acetolactate synthase large subunit [bacterium]